MTWNWQQKDWPRFEYDATALTQFEAQFLYQSGIILGAYKHLTNEDQTAFNLLFAITLA